MRGIWVKLGDRVLIAEGFSISKSGLSASVVRGAALGYEAIVPNSGDPSEAYEAVVSAIADGRTFVDLSEHLPPF